MYRDRKEPYIHANPLAPAYFQTHAPSEWTDDANARASYGAIYGAAALEKAVTYLKVCENTNPVWVAGTYWESVLGKACWKCEEVAPKPEEIPAVGYSKADLEILRRLDEIRDILLSR